MRWALLITFGVAASDRWSLETLLAAAAAFPANVAESPHHTSAVLTKYSTNRSFLKWADEREITVRDYATVERYTGDLLDMFGGYQNNIGLVSDVIAHPEKYRVSSALDAINIVIEDLVQARNAMKVEVRSIVGLVEQLCVVLLCFYVLRPLPVSPSNTNPEKLIDISKSSKVEYPELWRIRLPVRLGSPLPLLKAVY